MWRLHGQHRPPEPRTSGHPTPRSSPTGHPSAFDFRARPDSLLPGHHVIHYISFFDPPWHDEVNVADALDHHQATCTRYNFPDPLDRPGRGGKPAIKSGDIVFTSVPSRFPIAELLDYKARGAILVCWYFDWIWKLQNRAAVYLPRLLLMDAIFSTDGFCGGAYILRHVNCRHYLPQAAAPLDTLPPPTPGTEKHDVVFLGHLWTQDRRELARRLRVRCDFANLGNGPRIWGRPLSDICQTSAIMIGTNYRNDVAGYWSDRCYVVMGSGGFYLGQYVKGLDRTFEDDVHCGFFFGLDDMEKKVDYWLSHPAEREACRRRGHCLVQSRHTYTHRVGQLLAALKARRFLA